MTLEVFQIEIWWEAARQRLQMMSLEGNGKSLRHSQNISTFKGIPFILRLILYQNIFHFMPFLFVFIQSPAFLGNPRINAGARFARTAETMETECVGGL